MQRSQTTESFGMLIVTQQITIGLTIEYKILIGTVKVGDWVTEDSDKMFYDIEEKK